MIILMSYKRKLVVLSLKDKLDIIYTLKRGVLRLFLSNKYGIGIFSCLNYLDQLNPRLVQIIKVLLGKLIFFYVKVQKL